MASRTLWRRSATAVGVYSATIFGFFGSIAATRELGTHRFAQFATVVAIYGFVQLLLDLTIEEAQVKYGFRYAAAEDWGRFRRVLELAIRFKLAGAALGTICVVSLAPAANAIWHKPLTWPIVVAGLIPLAQAPEGVAANVIILRGRYDVRGFLLANSMLLRFAGIAVGSLWGVLGAVSGMLGAQVLATATITVVGWLAYRRFPRAESRPLGSHRREFRNFVISSTAGSSLISARDNLATSLMGMVSPLVQAGYFANAQAPATGFYALSAPVRLVLLTEQTDDFERGRLDRVWGMLRRYVVATTLLMLVAVPLAWYLMPWLIQIPYGLDFRRHATTPARLILISAALQLIFGWAKSFPVSIGRPNLRLMAHGLEIAVFVPLVVVLGSRWGATGGAAATICSTSAFCILWTILLLRLRRQPLRPAPGPEEQPRVETEAIAR